MGGGNLYIAIIPLQIQFHNEREEIDRRFNFGIWRWQNNKSQIDWRIVQTENILVDCEQRHTAH